MICCAVPSRLGGSPASRVVLEGIKKTSQGLIRINTPTPQEQHQNHSGDVFPDLPCISRF